MKRKLLLLTVLFVLSYRFCDAQPYEVTLKVIDKTGGAKTNSGQSWDLNTNIFAWLDDALAAQNPRIPSDWWYPLYYDSGVTSPNGNMTAENGTLVWSLKINVSEGENYAWNPYVKSFGNQTTYGWKPLNKSVAYYGESDNLVFSVAADGTITGTTEIVIENQKFPVTLEVLDLSNGEKTNSTENDYDRQNIFFDGSQPSEPAWCSTNLYWEFINPVTDGDWVYRMYPTQGNAVQENANGWIWSADITVSTGCYTWRPQARSTSGTINSTIYEYDEGSDGFLQFNVALDGTVTGVTRLTIPESTVSVDNEAAKIPFDISVNNREVSVVGDFSCVKVFNLNGQLLVDAKADINYTISLTNGIYIISVDGTTRKIIIK